MKKLLSLLFVLCAFLFTPAVARADDSGGPPQPPPPAPSQPADKGDAGTKTTARKEDEDEAAARASKMSKMAALFKGKAGLADDIAAHKARADKAETDLAKAETDLAAALKKIDALTKENATLKEEWAALEEAAAGLGDGKDEKQQQSPQHQKAAGIINTQVAKELRAIGHQPKEKAAADKEQTKNPEFKPAPAQAAAAIQREKWAAAGYVPPGLN